MSADARDTQTVLRGLVAYVAGHPPTGDRAVELRDAAARLADSTLHVLPDLPAYVGPEDVADAHEGLRLREELL